MRLLVARCRRLLRRLSEPRLLLRIARLLSEALLRLSVGLRRLSETRLRLAVRGRLLSESLLLLRRLSVRRWRRGLAVRRLL
jgi:hypothetical protein